MLKLLKENCQYDLEISALRQELETTKREYKQQCTQMESQTMVSTLYSKSRCYVLLAWHEVYFQMR